MSARIGWWAAVLAAALLPAAGPRAEDVVWRPASAPDSSPPAALGRPVPADGTGVSPVSYSSSDDIDQLAPTRWLARGQPPDVPPPVGGAPPPPPPPDGFNPACNPEQPLRHGFWDKCKEYFNFCGDKASASGRCTIQSDPCFNGLASPVSNPFLFEDPRALTELRPIFIYQRDPGSTGGGSSTFVGTQARLALNEHWSFVVSELGWVFFEPNTPPAGLSKGDSFAQLTLGPKWTFYRCPDTNTVAAAGLDFQIPTGGSRAFQDTGTLSLVPYLSAAQGFRLPQGYGAINMMGTTGFAFSVDRERSEYFFLSAHVDYDVANLHKIYPFLELNWFYYARGGTGPALGFEGTDLFNFGSSSLGSKNFVDLAPGIRYKFSEAIQAGLAVEFPLTSQKELTDWRITLDLIFRY
jgi:hypothetical protein